MAETGSRRAEKKSRWATHLEQAEQTLGGNYSRKLPAEQKKKRRSLSLNDAGQWRANQKKKKKKKNCNGLQLDKAMTHTRQGETGSQRGINRRPRPQPLDRLLAVVPFENRSN